MIVLGVDHNAREFNISPCYQIDRHAKYLADRIALSYEGKEYNYQEFHETVLRWAAHLDEAGVRRGDRVAYLGMNSESFLFGAFATWWLGAVFMPFNFRLSPSEASLLFAQGTPHTVIVEGSHVETAQSIYDIERHHVLVVDTDESAPPEVPVPIYWSKTSQIENIETSGVSKPVELVMSDLALLLFTSGTTGLPKGAQLTFGNLWWNSVNVDTMVDSRPGDFTLAAAPLFHIGALNSFAVRALARGNSVVVHRNFDPEQVFADVEKYEIASTFLVPAQLDAMYRHPKFADAKISSLRAVICAGAPVPPALIRRYMEHGVSIQQAWGLTETSPFATYLPPEKTKEKLGSCGIPMPHTQVKLVDVETGEEVKEPNKPGEMWVKGPNVAVGYWNNPEVTQKSYTAGWFHSGDIGTRDEDGYYYVVDRLKDMIISGGENVYPAEVERVIAEHDDVVANAVVGMPNEKWGEEVVAVIQLVDGTSLTLEELRAHCDNFLARYKLPRRLELVDEIPRNAGGKIDKLALRATLRQKLAEEEAQS